MSGTMTADEIKALKEERAALKAWLFGYRCLNIPESEYDPLGKQLAARFNVVSEALAALGDNVGPPAERPDI